MKQFIPPILWPLFENLTVAGCVLVTVGTMATLLLPLIRGRVDRVAQRGRRNASAFWTWMFWVIAIAGPCCIGVGTWLTAEGGQRGSSQEVARAEKFLRDAREEIARSNREIAQKIQETFAGLQAAKQEETRQRTGEKIDKLYQDFSQWAEDFDKRRPNKQKQLEQAKTAALQRELQMSADSMPLFSYVIKFIDEVVTAYSEKHGRQIRADIPPLPDNFFATDVNNIERAIHFSGGKAVWSFSLSTSYPAREDQPPQLQISLTNAEGRGGNIYINQVPKTGRFNISASGVLPSPDAAQMSGQYSMAKFEETIRQLFMPLIEAQLAETP
jgi:hypothetical protein